MQLEIWHEDAVIYDAQDPHSIAYCAFCDALLSRLLELINKASPNLVAITFLPFRWSANCPLLLVSHRFSIEIGDYGRKHHTAKEQTKKNMTPSAILPATRRHLIGSKGERAPSSIAPDIDVWPMAADCLQSADNACNCKDERDYNEITIHICYFFNSHRVIDAPQLSPIPALCSGSWRQWTMAIPLRS